MVVETWMWWWALVLASSISLLPRCVTCQDGVFRVPLTLQHDYNETATHTLQAASGGPIVLGGQKVSRQHTPKKNKAVVEVTPLFTGLIKLGGQPFEILFDTGSKDVWVFGTDVNKELLDEDGHDHHFYNYMEESTTGEPFKESYGNKREFTRVSGVKVMDILSIGDLELNPFQFGVVNKIEVGEHVTTRYDGVMGLSYQTIGTGTSAFTTMVRQRRLRLPMFSVYVAEDSTRGEILFGSWDDRYFTYPFEVNGIVPIKGRWIIKITKMDFGGNVLQAEQEGKAVMLSLVDTGCSNMHLPPALLFELRAESETLNNALDRYSGTYGYVPCSFRRSLPVLKFEIGSRVYVLTGEEYTTTLGSVRDSYGQEWCRLEIDDTVPRINLMVIGMPFFRKYYTMFFHEYDGYEGPVVAFAEAKHPRREAPAQRSTDDADCWCVFCV